MSDLTICQSHTPISSELYYELVHYFKFASSAYASVCPRPNGCELVLPISNPVTDIQGYVARDDEKREIIVSLRGSASVTDILLDAQILLVPFKSPGVSAPSGANVHTGFLTAWNSVAVPVLATVKEQLLFHKGYTLVSSGHSLGGALAVLAGISLSENFDDSDVKCYSYGAPRVGDDEFADFANTTFGGRSFRVVHCNDGVPTIIPREPLGYHHHGVEYWQKAEPASSETIVRCSEDGEDSSCSASIPSEGVNADHTVYFGILATTPFCV